MEDGCVGGFVQRGTAAAEDEELVVEMGGTGAETQTTRATEAAVRGFWKEWRRLMGYDAMTGADTLLRLATLNTAYAACIDADRLEDWPGFFHERCLYKITTADNHKRGYAAGMVYADSRAMLQDRVSALRQANIYERQNYRHIVGMPLVGAEQDGRDQRRDAVPGGAHDARRPHGSVRDRRLSRSPARGRRRSLALHRTAGDLRQLALRHAAGDPAVSDAAPALPVTNTAPATA